MKINFGALLIKWRVAFLCSAIYFHHLGIQRIVTFLFVGTIEQYGVDRNKASFPDFLKMTVAGLIGPIAGYLGCKYRLENLILLGCLVSALGIALCYFAENITMVTLCWGLLLGIGHGLTLVTTTFLSWHYRKDNSVANGISFAGASIGGVVYTILAKIFIDNYKLSGTYLLVAAISLHSVPAAMLLTDSRFLQKTLKRKDDFESRKKKENLPKPTHHREIFGRSDLCKSENIKNDEKCISGLSYKNISLSHKDKIKHPELESVEVVNQKACAYDCKLPIANNLHEIPKQVVKRQTVYHASRHVSSYEVTSENILEDIQKKEKDLDDISSDNRKKDVFANVKDGSRSQTPIRKQEKKAWESFRLFYNPLFILIAFLQSSHMGLLILLTNTIGEYAVDKGFTMNDATVLLVSGYFSEFIGRVSFGWVTDKGFMSLANFGATFYIVAGISFMAVGLSIENIELNISYFTCSLACGGLMPVYVAIISEIFEGDLKTMALSARYILFLPISFTFPLLVGYFRDQLGSYLGLYYSMAVFCGTCALLLMLLPSLQKCCKF